MLHKHCRALLLFEGWLTNWQCLLAVQKTNLTGFAMLVSVQYDQGQRLLEHAVSQGADQYVAYEDRYLIEAGAHRVLYLYACGVTICA